MKKVLVSLVVIGFAVTSCQKSGEQKTGEDQSVEQIRDQVMAIHDEVMRTEEIMDLKEKISHQIDSLSKITPATPVSQNRQQEGIAINQSLTEADELMNDWMHNYRSDTLDVLDEAQAKAYLNSELKKITVVKEKVTGGISQAKKFLGN
ncbi:hypothetical protein [Larkinella terrae]|uniref:Viral A-type inclusion protein n=1 Tax=Larkinella terrae TaxID=2025311 RepID=A0A7K0EKK6_9BACT|nr:hypothetical protein [Larkinella terrae]MRS62061.1 hypothetical protein [Larkinella terrae]